ncbi:MAG: 1,4-dihydroxy-2-naphthoate octaprenyltransferase [Bacteroidota bacterium]|nr:1,4-dihydroxy-2-naphthoate octaprenyltransferase [Bacteroidota bacterium]
MPSIKNWLHAARLRTLPLALSGVLMGSVLVYHFNTKFFSWPIFVLNILTALLLQILSNFANDYGDFLKGTDNDTRIGNVRAMQSGAINKKQMQTALFLFTLLSLCSGLLLLFMAFGKQEKELQKFLVFLLLGLVAIAAAIKYTVGKKNYGYRALGDLAVFIFFGPLAICGTYYLQIQSIDWPVYFAAAAIGLLSVGVLNINNIRDIENDKASNKTTIANLLGEHKAKIYHTILLSLAMTAFITLGMVLFDSLWKFISLLALAPILHNSVAVLKTPIGPAFNLFLKQLALSTFFMVAAFCIALLL